MRLVKYNYLLLICLMAFIVLSCGNRSKPESLNSNIKSDMDVELKTESDLENNIVLDKSVDRESKTYTILPRIDVYIENSGSMDGYVKGTSEFKQAVYNYLCDIKISKSADTIALNYINSQVIPQGRVIENYDILKDFVEKLDPYSFKMKGGNRGTSDISDVIKIILTNPHKYVVSMLVTDGIFSPGKAINAENYLVNQEIGIKTTMASFLDKEEDAAVIIYQLSSQFTGTYYNKVDSRTQLNGEQRPYYIWLIGSSEHLKNIRSAVPESKFNGGGIKNIFTITKGNKSVDYTINNRIGIKKRTIERNTILNLEKDRRGTAKFAIDVDFSKLLLDEYYLTNSANYEYNSDFDLNVIPYSGTDSYTHTLVFSSDKLHPKGELAIKLKIDEADWVKEANDSKGDVPIPNKTYGIKHQINGVMDAFTFNSDYYTVITVNIK